MGNNDLLKYMGLAMQIMAGLGVSVFVGYKADKYLNALPLCTVLLPLLMLIGLFYKIYKESTKQSK
jgi:F0F1-type ATP synthase assembly protein I